MASSTARWHRVVAGNQPMRRHASSAVRHVLATPLRAARRGALQTRLCSTVAAEAKAPVTPPSRSQLFRLAAGVGVPMVGFGIADNAIMIVAGDRIDATLGVKFGFSTLAAAGLGNLLSDVCGISLGEVIEGWCVRLGLEAPQLTAEQAAMRSTRMLKWGAGALGISIGCLIGMLPLLFMQDRKQVYFTDDDLALFQRQFAPYGVSADQFFALMQTGQWHVAEPGATLVRQGEKLDRVMLIHSGVAESYATLDDGSRDNMWLYMGRAAANDKDTIEERHAGSGPVDSLVRRAARLGQIRGCIIGGTALVEPDVLQKPYPNQVVVHDTMRYVSWSTEELREAMREDKSIESAVYSTLYLDLVEGLRMQRKGQRHRSGVTDARSTAQAEYAVMMRAVVADGLVHPLEKSLLNDFASKHGLGHAELLEALEAVGWSSAEWEEGIKRDMKSLRSSSTAREPPEIRRDPSRSAEIRREIGELPGEKLREARGDKQRTEAKLLAPSERGG